MAVVRARTSPPYGLFISVFLAVVFAALTIIFYVMYSKATTDNDTAMKRSSTDRTQNATYQTQIRYLSELLAGNNPPAYDSLKDDPVLKSAASEHGSIKGALTFGSSSLDKTTAALKQANDDAKSAGDRAAAAEKKLADSVDMQQKTVDQLTAQIAKLNKDIADANSGRDKAVADAQAQVDKAKSDTEESKRQLLLENQQLKSQLAQRTDELAQVKQILQNRSGGLDQTAGEADGHIISVNPAASECYIDLTSKDHVLPGLTFTVYDPRLGVRYGTDDAAQGNGTIEVLQPGDSYTLCRITHQTKGHAIQSHDLIANVVFSKDKTRHQHFVVYGDFDLDGDGVATAAERDRLISMIKHWGGEIDDHVTSQTDYVVLGSKPASPTIVEDTTTAPATGSAADQRVQEQDRYEELQSQARGFGIPVLDANRFLSMIGYYSTTIVRY